MTAHFSEAPASESDKADRVVRKVESEMEISAEISQVLVTSQGQAEALRFLGSPTVQVNGQDIEPAVRHINAFGLM